MKKVVAFFLVLIIFVAPVTTLVKADVVIGDNDDIIINENATILGRKLALMESLSDLALSGVTEFTISNTTDVDSYLDSLWSELDDAIDSLSNGTGFNEISNNLKSKYFTNLVQYKDYINNRGDYFANLLQNPSTSLLSTFFANNIFGKHSTLHNNLSLDMFRALSQARNSGPTPSPDPDFSFINNVNFLYLGNSNILQYDKYIIKDSYGDIILNDYLSNYTIISDNYTNLNSHLPGGQTGGLGLRIYAIQPITTIRLYTQSDDTVLAYYDNNVTVPFGQFNDMGRLINIYQLVLQGYTNDGYLTNYWSYSEIQVSNPYLQNSFAGISTAINYIYQHYANINLYVDNELWVLADSDTSSNPTLDIDGYLKIYGNDLPRQYLLQPNTKIDYDQLYQVIYNAIRDNLPISQGDINYYDSHDTIYSPTIINNYGEEEGDESDLIDTILDYAVIPKFDPAIAQPMRDALTNGVVIMNNSITNVIPNEILIILGACFFLLLFAVVINRMIK